MTFEDAVAHLMAQTNCSRAFAESQVREQLPHLVRQFPPTQSPRDAILEKAESVEVRKLLIAYGFRIYNLSQARASKQTPGLPDIWFSHTSMPLAGWFEVKRSNGGVLSKAQIEFAEDCARCGILCLHGDRYAAQQLLVDLHLAIRIDDRIEPARLYQPTAATSGG